ncbi:MAG: DUF5050 domain-containing protein [Bacteroidota bacterium]
MNSGSHKKGWLLLLVVYFAFLGYIPAQNSYFFYSFNDDPWTFNRRNNDGTNPLLIYTPASYSIQHSAVDGSNNKVVFYEGTSNSIFRSELDGSGKTTILTASGPLYDMTAGNGYVFYSYINSPYSVRRCNVDGSNDIQLYVNPAYGNVCCLAFDAASNYLYYYETLYDNANNRVFRTNADGTNMTVIYNNCPKISALAAGAGYVYYSFYDSPWTLNRADYNGAGKTAIYTPSAGSVDECTYDATIGKIFFYDNNVGGSKVIYRSDPDGANRTSVFTGFTQKVNTLSAPTMRSIAFTDGNGFTQSITPNSTNQVLGLFRLTAASGGAVLTEASVKLNNVRTGLSNLKLWSSADPSFGSDSQLGSTIASDPGDGGTVTFSGFSSGVSTGGTYYLLTGDISDSPTGTVRGEIVQKSDLNIVSGLLSGTITNAVLSSGSSPLPVELTAFAGKAEGTDVKLTWQTATEINNHGFEIERALHEAELAELNYEKISFAAGAGNSNSTKSYAYTDKALQPGKYSYRLKQIDTDGKYSYSETAEITIGAMPQLFELSQNFPNPFNPSTLITYMLPSAADVTLKVYDLLGREVASLTDGWQEAGTYQISFNAGDLSSGLYIAEIKAGAFSQRIKMTLVK